MGKNTKNLVINIRETRILAVVFALALIFFSLSMLPMLTKQSGLPYYIHLADSLLHGKLYLDSNLISTFDLLKFNGNLYLPGGITPALLLTPIVAIGGTTVSDIGFGAFIGAVNVMLMFSLLRQIGGNKDKVASSHIWITVLFAAGTVNWWITSISGFWFLAQIVTITFMILFVKETLKDKRPWLSGLWLGLAVLSRPTTMFSVVFYFSFSYLKSKSLRKVISKSLPFIITLSFCISIMLLYNFLRFGNWFDFGYGYLIGGTPELVEIYNKFGGFNLRYLPCNLYIFLFGLPNIFGTPHLGISQVCWHLEPVLRSYLPQRSILNSLGLSVFLTTPTFFYLFKTKWRPLNIAAGLGILSILIPLLLYHNTGYFQFGYRYILDFIVFVFIILASVLNELSLLKKLSIGVSILINFTGFTLMYTYHYSVSWFDTWINLIEQWLTILKIT